MLYGEEGRGIHYLRFAFLGHRWHIVRKGGVQYCHLRLRTSDILDLE